MKELKAFADSLMANIQATWKCKACMGFHFWAKAPAPAGMSSGNARHHPIPKRILKLIAETEEKPLYG
jgi:hypothetical protein